MAGTLTTKMVYFPSSTVNTNTMKCNFRLKELEAGEEQRIGVARVDIGAGVEAVAET